MTWAHIARPYQLPPDGPWRQWLLLGGRGWGKTRAAAEYVRQQAESGAVRYIGLAAESFPATNWLMLKGESGLLSIAEPRSMPIYRRSSRTLEWPNGTIAFVGWEYSGIDGMSFDLLWVENMSAWKDPTGSWERWSARVRGGEGRTVVTADGDIGGLPKALVTDSATHIVAASK